MDADRLCPAEQAILLEQARHALTQGVLGNPLEALNLEAFPPKLRQPGATFVTLTIGGNLRGCVGALEPYQPLIEDVREHAVAAALEDYRFNPVSKSELSNITIEISRLTPPTKINYAAPEELKTKIRPGVDGVVLRDGTRRATFLPQVWEQISDFDLFMTQLCYKMGTAGNIWKHKILGVEVYQVEEFHE